MTIFPDTRSLTRLGAATAGPVMVVVAGSVVVVVVEVSVTQLPLELNTPFAHAPQYGLYWPTTLPVCVLVVRVVCVVWVVWAPDGPATRLAANSTPVPSAIAKNFC